MIDFFRNGLSADPAIRNSDDGIGVAVRSTASDSAVSP